MLGIIACRDEFLEFVINIICMVLQVSRTHCEKEMEIHILKCELEKAQEKIKHVTAELEDEKLTNEILVGEVKDAKDHTSKLLNRAKINLAKVSNYM